MMCSLRIIDLMNARTLAQVYTNPRPQTGKSKFSAFVCILAPRIIARKQMACQVIKNRNWSVCEGGLPVNVNQMQFLSNHMRNITRVAGATEFYSALRLIFPPQFPIMH
ncbi:MAG: hypothetical protein C9356_12675 [Oleiphilus sp.]|nr:MAG: hypothetical protein C9356_12675 [Oleiphilus sp.]